MKISKIALFKTVNEEVADAYSRHKLGDVHVTGILGEQLAELIAKKTLLTNARALYTTNKYPLNQFCKKNSLLLSEIVASKLSLPLYVGEYRYQYNLGSFYDDHTQRHSKVHPPFLDDKENIRNKHYEFVMVDDSTVSGNTLQASLSELKQVTDTVEFFVLVDLEGRPEKEKELNEHAFNNGGITLLEEIISQPDYVFTSHMVRTIEKLNPASKKQLLDKIGESKSVLFKKAKIAYLEEIISE